jgi:anti-sigma factor RsiW
MKCRDAEKLFSALLEGELSAEEEDRLRAHLAECAIDRDRYRAFEHTVELVRTLPREEAPADFTASVMQELRRARHRSAADYPIETQRRARILRLPETWQWPQLAAAAAGLALGIVSGAWMLTHPGNDATTNQRFASSNESTTDPTSAPLVEAGTASQDSGQVPLPVWEQFERMPVQQVTSGNERATIIF